ncbi:MAG: MltA domain-containing protein [Phycisphaerales bacterium]
MLHRSAAFFAIVILLASGCKTAAPIEEAPDYSRQLGPGESALRRITDPARMPNLAAAWDRSREYEGFLMQAIDKSLVWFAAPSSQQFFPMQAGDRTITHALAQASVEMFRDVIDTAPDAFAFEQEVNARFDVFESVGYDNQGTVLYTGYYAPVFNASNIRTSRFTAPLYRRPADLVTDPVTGKPLGRKAETGEIVPYYTRKEINDAQMFAGSELVWLEDELSAYIIHVNGSAKLRMADGSTMYVGYAGKTDRPYYGLGRSMLDEGILNERTLSLPAIRNEFRKNPDRVIELMNRNENYVFFTTYQESNWPAGSLGVQVTEEASLATDKEIYPRGGVVLVDTEAVTLSYNTRPFLQFMLDQDTGGAIKAPGRADIFMGTGETAEILAGGQYAEGRLFYFFLKDE